MHRTFLYSAAIVLVINGAPDRAVGATTQVFGQTAPVANRSALCRVSGAVRRERILLQGALVL